MGKTGISVKMQDADAKRILKEFSRERRYLESLINSYVPESTREDVNQMDYSRLLHYGHVIHGVATKIVKNLERKSVIPEQLSLFR